MRRDAQLHQRSKRVKKSGMVEQERQTIRPRSFLMIYRPGGSEDGRADILVDFSG